jgi:folate-dependent phosphoribosylglycinamide formyltransferase PurN
LNGVVSDPDKDKVAIKWWQFQVGTYPGKITIATPNAAQTKVLIPKDAVSGQTIHVILEATDNGSPPLTAYQRVIITVK